MSNTDIGAKVSLKLRGQWVNALVRSHASATTHTCEQVLLRIAIYNTLAGEWVISDYPTPVQAYKLRRREALHPELDCQIDAIIAAHAPVQEIDEEARLASLEQHWQDRKAIERDLPTDYRQLF